MGMLTLDSPDNLRRDRGVSPCRVPRRELDGRDLGVRLEEAFELADGNQSRTPRCLDRVQGRDDASVEGRDADTERFGCLLSGVDESFGTVCDAEILRRSPGVLRRRGICVAATLLDSLTLSFRRHSSESVHEY